MKKLIYSAVAACTLSFSAVAQDKANLAPVEAAELWGNDMMKGNVTSLWHALPKKYQTDMESMVQAMGQKMDAELYNEFIKTIAQFNGFLKDKKDIVLDLMEENVPGEDRQKFQDVKKNYSEMTDLIDALVNSNIKNVDGLKNFDMKAFCAMIEPNVQSIMVAMKAMKKDFKDGEVDAKLISREGDNAVVEVTGPCDKSKKVNLTRMGDRWVPVEMTKDWDKKMKEAKDKIAQMDKMKPEQKAMASMMLNMAQGMIKEANKANSADELKKMVENKMKMFGPMFMGRDNGKL